jgi:hypothetical protein
MNEDEQRAVDALLMLRAAADEVMARKGASADEDVIGEVITLPRENLSRARYDAAIAELQEAGALVRGAETDEADDLLSTVVGEPEAFKITSRGVELLRKAREMGM